VNAHSLAKSAYGQHGAPTRTVRSTEYDIIARITHRLHEAAQSGTRDFATLAAAIHENRRLWTLLATDAADAGNVLPDEIRARIVYLAEFTRIHSSNVLKGKGHAAPLVEINTAVLRGLRAGGAQS